MIPEPLYQNLVELDSQSFPKKCRKCGHVYPTFRDFIEDTQGLADTSGLKQYTIGRLMILLHRNCACESTLIVNCRNRRNDSVQGIKRRQSFGVLMAQLVQEGIAQDEAKIALTKVIKGESSPLVDEFRLPREVLKDLFCA